MSATEDMETPRGEDEPQEGSSSDPAQPSQPTEPQTQRRTPPARPRHSRYSMSGLHRSSNDRMIAGVAGGLAESTGIPPLIIRLLFVVSATFLVGLVVYAIAWAVLPDGAQLGADGTDPGSTNHVIGRLFVAAGITLAVITLPFGGVLASGVSRLAFPLMLILIGLALIGRKRDGSERTPTHPVVDASVTPPTAPHPITSTTTPPPPMGSPPNMIPGTPPSPAVRRSRPILRFPYVGLLTWSSVLVVVGLVAATAVLGGPILSPGAAVALALIVFSAGLIISAFRGRARGLILPILTLTAVLGTLAVIDVRISSFDGPLDLVAETTDDLPEQLHSAAGNSTLRLTRLVLDEDRTLRVGIDFGSLRVDLPLETTVVVKGRVGMGSSATYRHDRSATAANTEVQKEWITNGVPAAGSTVEPSLFDENPQLMAWFYNLEQAGESGNEGLGVTLDSTFDRGSEHVLTLDVDVGIGAVDLVEPIWGSDWWEPAEATQLCTIGNGSDEPCGDLDETSRVALCINDAGYLVDCRTDRPGTQESPRIAACRDLLENQVDCSELGIDPVGATLIGPTEDVPPIDPEGTAPPATNAWTHEPDDEGDN